MQRGIKQYQTWSGFLENLQGLLAIAGCHGSDIRQLTQAFADQRTVAGRGIDDENAWLGLVWHG